MQKRTFEQVINHAWMIIIGCILVLVALAIGGQNLYFRGDYKTFFREDNPQRLAYEEMQKVFSKNETANILIARRDGDVFDTASLSLIRDMTEDAWQTPFVSRVNSIANFQHTYSEDDDLIVDKLIPRFMKLTDQDIAYVQNVSLNEPDIVNRLISPDGEVAVVSITVRLGDGDQTAEINEITQFVRTMADKYQSDYPEHEFYLTGVVLLNNAFHEAANKDAATLVPAMFLAVFIMVGIMLRSIWTSVATILIIAPTIAATMGFGGWLGYFLSMSTVNVPTMVMTIAVADCIHVMGSWLIAMRNGQNKRDALIYSLSINCKPIVITSVTTAIGFLTLNFSEVPILADLGNMNAFGVMLACVLSLTLLPAILYLLPTPKIKVTNNTQTRLGKFSSWVVGRHKRILPYSALVFGVAIALTFTNQINDIAIKYFDKENTFRQATDFQDERLSGLATMDFAIYTDQMSGLNNPKTLAIVQAFTEWLRAQPEVDHVSSISDTYKRLNKNMNGDDPAFYKLPEEQDLAAQYMLLFEMSLPFGLDLNNQIDIDKSATRVMVTLDNLGSKELTEFEQRAYQWFDEVNSSLRITAASPALMFAHIGETNMKSMLEGSLLALVLISGLLIFALGSFRLGLISLIPNMLPAGVGFGIWALLSGEINMALSVVISMTLGIIVDDTVHFLSKYKLAREQGKTAEECVHYAFETVGHPLVVTTIVLAVGFGVLTLSSFALNADMGLLTAIILVCALVVDFVFLPAFLLVLDKTRKASST